jgi:hypothetical protein
MATSSKTLIDAAFARSTFNDPGKLANDPELIAVIDRRVKQLYSLASGINPTFFGDQDDVTGVGGAFAIPTDAEMVLRIEEADGTEVNIVPFEDRTNDLAPRVYQFGSSYYTVGAAGDPGDTDTLTFFFSKRHPDLNPTLAAAHATNNLDASWPQSFNDLIVLHLSKYLAVKDSRSEEVPQLEKEETALLQVFVDHIANSNYGMKSRWIQRAPAVGVGVKLS